jgi:DNA-binding Xre family transcriptional regulator
MLTTKLSTLFKLRGIEKPRLWLVKQGINPQTATRLLNNQQAHLKFAEIEKICLGLNCAPTDLFQWQPDSEAQNIPGHPLQAIRSDLLLPDVVSRLKSATLDELKLVDELLAKVKEERLKG